MTHTEGSIVIVVAGLALLVALVALALVLGRRGDE